MGGGGKQPILVVIFMEMRVTENCTNFCTTRMVTNPPLSERKLLTDRNAAPKILGCSAQEERGGGKDRAGAQEDR